MIGEYFGGGRPDRVELAQQTDSENCLVLNVLTPGLRGKRPVMVYIHGGGYISGSTALIDAVRSYAPGFIFTTALPPSVAAAATAAIRHLKTSHWERERHQDRAARTKAVLAAARLPVMTSPTHIVPVYVGDPELCKAASDLLLADHGLYLQPINYPTVPKGTERLRITPSPYHEDALIDALAEALVDVWQKLGLPFKECALAGVTFATFNSGRHA